MAVFFTVLKTSHASRATSTRRKGGNDWATRELGPSDVLREGHCTTGRQRGVGDHCRRRPMPQHPYLKSGTQPRRPVRARGAASRERERMWRMMGRRMRKMRRRPTRRQGDSGPAKHCVGIIASQGDEGVSATTTGVDRRPGDPRTEEQHPAPETCENKGFRASGLGFRVSGLGFRV